MFYSFLSIAPLHQLPKENILQREKGGGGGDGSGGEVLSGSVGDHLLVVHSRLLSSLGICFLSTS